MKTKLSIAAGFLVGAALLFLAFRNIDLRGLMAIYARVNPWYILPFMATGVLELALRAARWRLLLSPSGRVRLWDAFRLEAAGLALNNILPLRLGEIIRGTFGSRVFGAPMVTVFATIVVERALDVIVLFAVFGAAALLGGVAGGFAAYDGLMWAMLAGLAAALAALAFSEEIVAHAWFSGFFARFPRVRELFARTAAGVKGFRSPASAAGIICFAVLQWLLDALNCWWMACAFGLQGVVGAARSVALVFSSAVAASVPGMPGFFGNYEFTLARVMAAWGVQRDLALAYASYMHVVGYIFMTLLGVALIYSMGHSVGRLWGDFAGRAGEGR